MGVLMLTGALGPALGRLTDRCRAHRVVLVLGNFGLALACVAYDLSSERDAILGLSIGFIPDQDRWSTDTRLPASQLCAQPRRSDATAAFGQAQATMTALPRRCLDCGQLTRNGSRCQQCSRRRDQQRNRGTTTQRGYGSTWQAISRSVLDRDGYRCRYCGQPATTVDHIIPKARGGSDDPSNLVACCRSCNSAKVLDRF
jgi:5-methylcytosine-specific restriction enzyme A